MRQLKVQVERVVRPVRACIGRKMKMREELLAHLTASYQAGLASGLKEEAAVRHALERFGDPAVLRAELQASVPAVERVLFIPLPFHERIIKARQWVWTRRDDESSLHHAWRLWLIFALFVVGMDVVMFAPQVAYRVATGTAMPPSHYALFLAAFQGVPLACAFVYVLLLDEIQDALQTASSSVRRAARIGGWCLLSSALTLGAGMSIQLIVGNHLNWSSRQWFWQFVAACVLIPGMLVWQAIALAADRKWREEWENLVLDD